MAVAIENLKFAVFGVLKRWGIGFPSSVSLGSFVGSCGTFNIGIRFPNDRTGSRAGRLV